MIENDFGVARATILEGEGNRVDAAEEFWKEGQKLPAVESLLKDTANPESIIQAKDYILLILWGNISFDARDWPNNPETPLEDVAGLTDKLLQTSETALPHEDQLEVKFSSSIPYENFLTNGFVVFLV